METKPAILVVDDDLAVCNSLVLLLKKSGFRPRSIHHPRQVMDEMNTFRPDLVLLDMNFTIDTSGKQGLSLLESLQEVYPEIPVVLLTGWATVELAVKGMKAGAKDFVAKPWDNKQLIASIQAVLALQAPSLPKEGLKFDGIIVQNKTMLDILELARRVSKTDASVLIMGESGTGKELIAEAIHYHSHRANFPFVKVNLGGISTSLFESEMFGHKKGAFTDATTDRAGRFEMAEGGTIFLDEIGDLPMENQVKLLRVLQEKTFEALGSSQSRKIDVRVICATNKNLPAMVKEGTFREDLFYRINLIRFQLPPLRERREDIPLLVQYFIDNLKGIYNRERLQVKSSALKWLSEQNFPGNIRELKNLVERTVLISNHDVLESEDFKTQIDHSGQNTDLLPGLVSLETMEISMIKKALEVNHHKVSLAARSLGITRSALYRRLTKYNIPYDAQS